MKKYEKLWKNDALDGNLCIVKSKWKGTGRRAISPLSFPISWARLSGLSIRLLWCVFHQYHCAALTNISTNTFIIYPTPRIALSVGPSDFLPHVMRMHTWQSHDLSARRARRTKSRGPKGPKLEVGAPRFLVIQ